MTSTGKNTSRIGNLGESLACKYLENKGFSIITRNYWQKCGEIDVVARGTTNKSTCIHFIEVKAVSYETREMLDMAVSHDTYRPEELVHSFKLHQIHKALQIWISEHDYQGDFEIGVITVRMVPREKYSLVNYIENVIH